MPRSRRRKGVKPGKARQQMALNRNWKQDKEKYAAYRERTIREAKEQSDKLAARAAEIRAQTLFQEQPVKIERDQENPEEFVVRLTEDEAYAIAEDNTLQRGDAGAVTGRLSDSLREALVEEEEDEDDLEDFIDSDDRPLGEIPDAD